MKTTYYIKLIITKLKFNEIKNENPRTLPFYSLFEIHYKYEIFPSKKSDTFMIVNNLVRQ